MPTMCKGHIFSPPEGCSVACIRTVSIPTKMLKHILNISSLFAPIWICLKSRQFSTSKLETLREILLQHPSVQAAPLLTTYLSYTKSRARGASPRTHTPLGPSTTAHANHRKTEQEEWKLVFLEVLYSITREQGGIEHHFASGKRLWDTSSAHPWVMSQQPPRYSGDARCWAAQHKLQGCGQSCQPQPFANRWCYPKKTHVAASS